MAVALICFGGILMCYGVPLMPITSKVRAVATYVTNDVAPMKKLRDVPLRYRVAALVFGGTSLFLFGVVFAVLRQAYRVTENQAWAWGVLATLVAVVAAAGAFFALGAWVALSDPKSRLGSWFQRKMSVADAAEAMVFQLCVEGSMWVGFFLIPLGGSYSIIGVALLFCSGLIFFLIMRGALKSDIEAPDDSNDNPRANRLIGKSRERRSYDYRDQTERIPHPRTAAASIAIIGAFLFVASVGIVIANYPLHKVALVPPTKLPATLDTARDTGAEFKQRGPSLLAKCEILFPKEQGAVPGINCLKSGGNNSDLLNKTKQ